MHILIFFCLGLSSSWRLISTPVLRVLTSRNCFPSLKIYSQRWVCIVIIVECHDGKQFAQVFGLTHINYGKKKKAILIDFQPLLGIIHWNVIILTFVKWMVKQHGSTGKISLLCRMMNFYRGNLRQLCSELERWEEVLFVRCQLCPVTLLTFSDSYKGLYRRERSMMLSLLTR